MESSAEPRRAHPRRVVAGVDLFCYKAAAAPVPQTRVNLARELEDISPGGARLRVVEPLDQGESITIEVKDRKSGESFRARGEVRWCETLLAGAGQSHFVGIQFKEHYSPVELRDKFTLGAAPRVSTAVAPGLEKRKSGRFQVEDYVVTCIRQGTLAGHGLKRNIAREVLDLSTTGVQLNVTEKVEPGALVLFNFQLNTFPDGLESLAACRWCRPDPSVGGSSFRVGLEFVRLPDDRRRMIEFVKTWFEKRRRR